MQLTGFRATLPDYYTRNDIFGGGAVLIEVIPKTVDNDLHSHQADTADQRSP